MEDNKGIAKWKMIVAAVAIAVVFIVIGIIIGTNMSKKSFIAFEYNGSTTCYSLKSGKINASTSSLSGKETDSGAMDNLLNIDLGGIHNNKAAIEKIEKQVVDQGGRIISVIQ